MVGRSVPWVGLGWLVGCGPQAEGLDERGREAREALRGALQERDPFEVSGAARRAGPYKGVDAELDVLLGDALANVLMYPDRGWELLQTRRDTTDPTWGAAAEAAALRVGDPAGYAAVRADLGKPSIPLGGIVFDQLVLRARLDPQLTADEAADALVACAVLDAQSPRGRKSVDLPWTPTALDVAKSLGAEHIVFGRAESPADGDPLLNKGPVKCTTKRLYEPADLTKFPGVRGVTVGIAQGERVLHLDLNEDQATGNVWVFAASSAPDAVQLLQIADKVDQGADLAQSTAGLSLFVDAP